MSFEKLVRFMPVFSLAALVAACSIFRETPVRVDPAGPQSRWSATLNSPQRLSGALNITGSAWMDGLNGSASANGGEMSTEVHVQIENAVPGGQHPWEVHRGRCGQDRGIVGSPQSYEPLDIGDDGRASRTATLSVSPTDYQSYFVVLYASPMNRDLTIACGNFAPPS